MTAHSYISSINHIDNATFRAWGRELSNAIQTAGLIKITDAAQINWDTVVKPGNGGVGGYEIFQFNDALQATAPIFVKLEYGSAPQSNAAYPQIWVTVGTGHNGAGVLTGTVSTRVTTTMNGGGTSLVVPNTTDGFTTLISVKDGFFGLAWKCGASIYGAPNAMSLIMVGRLGNDDGTESGDGAYVLTSTPSTSSAGAGRASGLQTMNFASGMVTPRSTRYSLIPGSVTGTDVGTERQAFKVYLMTPAMRPALHLLTVLNSEYPFGTAFDAAPLGATPRQYVSLGDAATWSGAALDSNHALCMLWED